MEDVGGYYIRMLTNIDLFRGETVGLSIIFAWLGLFAMVYLFILATLILRARPSAAENRFMFLLLIAEGFKVSFDWKFLYPFGPEIMPMVQYVRVVWWFFLILSLLLYVSICAFYPVRFLKFMSRDEIRNNLYWGLPLLSGLIVALIVTQNGGIVGAFGGIGHVICLDATSIPQVTLYPGTKEIAASCFNIPEYHPYQYFTTGSTPLGTLLLFSQVFFAMIALGFMKIAQKTLENEGASIEKATEARALFIGFSGKVVFQGAMVAFMIFLSAKFGQINFADVAKYIGNASVIGIYMVGLYGFVLSILATAFFEGVMFTYAILKNEILGIDERLRKTFSTAVFAGTGGILFLVASEIMESMIGIGWIGGVLIGLPLIVLRKPILSFINGFSNVIMPESFTSEEQNYIEAYTMAMDDGIITTKERRMLELQAKSLSLDSSRIRHLESWFDSNLDSDEEE